MSKSLIVDERGRHFMQTAHEGADQVGRELGSWFPGSYSADGALLPELETLRDRTNDIIRNNGFASGAVQTHVDNVIGSGLLLNAKPDRRALGVKPEDAAMQDQLDELEDDIEAKFDAWSEDLGCYVDASRKARFSGLLAQAYRSYLMSFEILATGEWLKRSGTKYRTAVQMVDPARLLNQYNRSDDDVMRAGVERGKMGEPVAYHIASHIQGDFIGIRQGMQTWQRVPRETPWGRQMVIHIFDNDQPGQSRGKNGLVSVLKKHKMVDKWEGVALEAAIFNAMYAAYIQSSMDWPSVAHAMGAASTTGNTDADPTLYYLKNVSAFHKAAGNVTFNGLKIPHLYPGEELKHLAPQHPTAAFNSFEEASLRYLAAGWNLTYEQLSRDYCVAPDTRVLRADLRWVRADELTEGTEIVAFDEEAPGGKGGRRKWRKSSVLRAGRRELNRRRIVTDQATVTVSDEHQFLCTSRPAEGVARAKRGNSLKTRSETPGGGYCRGQRWVRADRLQPGDQIVFLEAPWAAGNTHLHGYLKGIIDGEGWIETNSASVGIAQNPGPVFDEIGEALATLGFNARSYAANGNKRAPCLKWQVMGIGQCLRLLGEIRPTRLLQNADHIYDGRMVAAGAKKSDRPTAATVLAVDDVGIGPVITIGTSTKTLITEGLCSHNSKTNYSSARAALLEAWRFFSGKQYMIGGFFASQIFALWLEEAIERGEINLPTGLPDFYEAKSAWCTCDWIGPGRGHIDPLKEENARKVRFSMKLTTLEREAALDGVRWRDLIDQQAQEARYAKKRGVDISGLGGQTPVAQPRDEKEGGEQDGQDEGGEQPTAPSKPKKPSDGMGAAVAAMADMSQATRALAERPQAPINIDARTTIAEGAVQTRYEKGAMQTTIADGAVRVNNPVHVAPAQVRVEPAQVNIEPAQVHVKAFPESSEETIERDGNMEITRIKRINK